MLTKKFLKSLSAYKLKTLWKYRGIYFALSDHMELYAPLSLSRTYIRAVFWEYITLTDHETPPIIIESAHIRAKKNLQLDYGKTFRHFKPGIFDSRAQKILNFKLWDPNTDKELPE